MKYNLFSNAKHTNIYAAVRPTYPRELFDVIFGEYKKSNPQHFKIPLCLDVACGSGQATKDLADFYCEKVIAVDGSENQILNATKRDNIEYSVHSAEDLSFLGDNSVDVVTVAQALHWFNLPNFFAQVQRVLRPKGVLAVWMYDLNIFKNAKAQEALLHFYQVKLDGYWSVKRKLVDDHYDSLIPQFPYQQTLKRTVVDLHKTLTIRQYVDYLESWSSIETYKQKNGEEAGKQLLENFANELVGIFNAENESKDVYETQVEIVWPIYLTLCTKQ